MNDVSVNVRKMKEVRRGLPCLARETITIDDAVLSGTPCVKGNRIPARDFAEMLANGDGLGAIRDAWPVLTVERIEAAGPLHPSLSPAGPFPDSAFLAAIAARRDLAVRST